MLQARSFHRQARHLAFHGRRDHLQTGVPATLRCGARRHDRLWALLHIRSVLQLSSHYVHQARPWHVTQPDFTRLFLLLQHVMRLMTGST